YCLIWMLMASVGHQLPMPPEALQCGIAVQPVYCRNDGKEPDFRFGKSVLIVAKLSHDPRPQKPHAELHHPSVALRTERLPKAGIGSPLVAVRILLMTVPR